MSYHIAFFSIPAHGHVMPTLAVVKELVRKGHRVTYLTTEEFVETVAGAGAKVVVYESTWSAPATLPNPRTSDGAARMRLLLLTESIATLTRAESRFADDLPDGLVYDTAAAPAARVLATKWGRPAVQMFTGVAFNESFSLAKELTRRFSESANGPEHPALGEHRRKLADFLRVQGMSDVRPEEFLTSAEGLSLVFQPQAFHIAGDSFDERYAFVGPCLDDRGFQGEWQPPREARPVVLISLGTLYNHQVEFFRRCVRAFTGVPWQVVIAVGHRVELDDLGPVPPNVEVHRWVPQLAVLGHARVFVSHAGMGSTMEALYFGTPLVTVPQTPEQDAVARRVAELGLGRRISGAEISAAGLREAVLEVAADDSVRRRVREMQRCVHDAGGPVRAAEKIEMYLGRVRPTGAVSEKNHAERIVMGTVLLAIGTRKGLFLARRRSGDWEIDGPRLTMNMVYALGIDTRRERPRLLVGTSHSHWGPALFRSDDLGASWQETEHGAICFPEGSGGTLLRPWQIQPVGPDQPEVVYVGTEPAALFRSADGGVTFSLVEGWWNHPDRRRLIEWIPEAGALYLHTVLVDPADSDILTVGISAGGVYRSNDAGATWTASNTGIESRSLPERYPEFGQCVHKISMTPSRPELLFLQNHGGVYRSENSGKTWTSIAGGLPADFGFTILAHPHRVGTVYVFPLVADTDRMPPDRRCRIYRTEDAGESWQPLSKGLPQQDYYSIVLRDAMCAAGGDPTGIYFGTRIGEVHASYDDGESWELVADHLPDVLCLRAIHSVDGGTWW